MCMTNSPTGAPGDSLTHPESDAGDDPMTPCPECGIEDSEYGLHNQGCPSGYPAWDPELDGLQQATREFEDARTGEEYFSRWGDWRADS